MRNHGARHSSDRQLWYGDCLCQGLRKSETTPTLDTAFTPNIVPVIATMPPLCSYSGR